MNDEDEDTLYRTTHITEMIEDVLDQGAKLSRDTATFSEIIMALNNGGYALSATFGRPEQKERILDFISRCGCGSTLHTIDTFMRWVWVITDVDSIAMAKLTMTEDAYYA